MNIKIKRTNDELKASRPTEDEIKKIPKLPISILVENVRSVHNVGSIFRTADGFGASKVYLTGYTACPPREDISKTALGADKVVPWEHFENPIDAAKQILKDGITLVLVEQTVESKSIYLSKSSYPSGIWIEFICGNLYFFSTTKSKDIESRPCFNLKCASKCLFQRFSRVSSERTTPHPNVSSNLLRSITVISADGSRSFIEIAKYRPAGPPPKHTMRMAISILTAGLCSSAQILNRTDPKVIQA